MKNFVRPWAIPGTRPVSEHRIGGLEKQNITGNVSYDPENHQLMVKIREEKIARIADHIPPQHLDSRPRQKGIFWCSAGAAPMVQSKAPSPSCSNRDIPSPTPISVTCVLSPPTLASYCAISNKC